MSSQNTQQIFATSVYPVHVDSLLAHRNPVLAVLVGRRGPVTLVGDGLEVSGDVLVVQPGIEHKVLCPHEGFNVIYLDGVSWIGMHPLADQWPEVLNDVACAAANSSNDALLEMRERLAHGAPRCPPRLSPLIADMVADPMVRISQTQLAARLGMERTQALRCFKAATGQTFRAFKQWVGLQHAARQLMAGEMVRGAALDAGFSDTAHLTRTFRHSFGLTPSQALAGLARARAS
ncbi:MAG: AraC family transcriptional regulator [Rhizobacter sp.]